MGTASNGAKQRWNASHYSQLKISVPPDLAAAFKAKCKAGNVSVTSEISRFMRRETGCGRSGGPPKSLYETRQKRRKALSAMIAQLEEIMEAEQGYMSNIPENLQNSGLYEAAEQAVSAMEEALDALGGAYAF